MASAPSVDAAEASEDAQLWQEAMAADGMTALQLAAWHNHGDRLTRLLDTAADTTAARQALMLTADGTGHTALHRAAWMGHLSVCELILHVPSSLLSTKRSKAAHANPHPSHLTLSPQQADRADPDMLHRLARAVKMIAARTQDGDTSLHFAAGRGHDLIVRYLLRVIHALEASIASFLMNQIDLQSMKRQSIVAAVAVMSNNDGDTPLHLAARNGHLECVQYLTQISLAPLVHRNSLGLSPIDVAASPIRVHLSEASNIPNQTKDAPSSPEKVRTSSGSERWRRNSLSKKAAPQDLSAQFSTPTSPPTSTPTDTNTNINMSINTNDSHRDLLLVNDTSGNTTSSVPASSSTKSPSFLSSTAPTSDFGTESILPHGEVKENHHLESPAITRRISGSQRTTESSQSSGIEVLSPRRFRRLGRAPSPAPVLHPSNAQPTHSSSISPAPTRASRWRCRYLDEKTTSAPSLLSLSSVQPSSTPSLEDLLQAPVEQLLLADSIEAAISKTLPDGVSLPMMGNPSYISMVSADLKLPPPATTGSRLSPSSTTIEPFEATLSTTKKDLPASSGTASSTASQNRLSKVDTAGTSDSRVSEISTITHALKIETPTMGITPLPDSSSSQGRVVSSITEPSVDLGSSPVSRGLPRLSEERRKEVDAFLSLGSAPDQSTLHQGAEIIENTRSRKIASPSSHSAPESSLASKSFSQIDLNSSLDDLIVPITLSQIMAQTPPLSSALTNDHSALFEVPAGRLDELPSGNSPTFPAVASAFSVAAPISIGLENISMTTDPALHSSNMSEDDVVYPSMRLMDYNQGG
eukprot:TRINITY_DN10194_c0_g1_i1.p1 TRINITY_DN10194_c0_g1~~TRINITY_DN10194_c0_g1_i1.p1  ORF type:complete len:811 (+),score=160.85 TRINITY_DN10194_c0_g1_i1:56-2488(+)